MFVSLLTGIPLKAYFGGLHTADVLGLKAPPWLWPGTLPPNSDGSSVPDRVIGSCSALATIASTQISLWPLVAMSLSSF